MRPYLLFTLMSHLHRLSQQHRSRSDSNGNEMFGKLEVLSSVMDFVRKVSITLFATATVGLIATATMSAVPQFFNIHPSATDHYFAVGASSFADLWVLLLISVERKWEYYHRSYACCVWTSSTWTMAVMVGLASGIMLAAILGHAIRSGLKKSVERVDDLRRSEQWEDVVTALLGTLFFYLAAVAPLMGALYVGTAWLESW